MSMPKDQHNLRRHRLPFRLFYPQRLRGDRPKHQPWPPRQQWERENGSLSRLAYDTSSMQPNILTGSMRDSVISEQPAGQGQKITGQSHGGVEQRYLHVGDRGDVQSHMDYDPVDVPQG